MLRTGRTIAAAVLFAGWLVPAQRELFGTDFAGPSGGKLPWVIVESAGLRITNLVKTAVRVMVVQPKAENHESTAHLLLRKAYGGHAGPLRPARAGREEGDSAPPIEYSGAANIWVRGSSSAFHPKKPYRLELLDENGLQLKAPLFGMPKESDWILFAAYTDKTLVRDVLGYELWRQMGHYAVRWRYVELAIMTNELILSGFMTNGYQGVYILMEKIKRGKHRVDIAKLRPEDSGEPEITGGYIFKKDRLNPGEHGFKSSQGIQFAFYEPKEKEITPPQKQWLTNYVNEFERVLFSDGFADPVTGYAKYIDVDSFIDFHWMVEVTRNIDGYRFSQFYHKDRGGKLAMGPIWDLDMSFGNAFYHLGYKTNGWRWETVEPALYTWLSRLFEDPEFLQRYIDRWAVLRTNVFATSNLLTRIDGWAAELGEAQVRNYQRWPTLGKFLSPNRYVGNTYQDEVNYLKRWITGRLAWIDTQGFPAPRILVASGVPPAATVTMSGEGGKIYYTLDGSDPRLRGGGISTNAVEYTSPFKLAPGTSLRARVRSEYELWSASAVIAAH